MKGVIWKGNIAIREKHSQGNGGRNSWSVSVRWKITHLELQGHVLQSTQEQRSRKIEKNPVITIEFCEQETWKLQFCIRKIDLA